MQQQYRNCFKMEVYFFCFYDFDEQFIFNRPSFLHQFIFRRMKLSGKFFKVILVGLLI